MTQVVNTHSRKEQGFAKVFHPHPPPLAQLSHTLGRGLALLSSDFCEALPLKSGAVVFIGCSCYTMEKIVCVGRHIGKIRCHRKLVTNVYFSLPRRRVKYLDSEDNILSVSYGKGG